MKIYHEYIKKGRFSQRTNNNLIYFNRGESVIIHRALEEYVRLFERKNKLGEVDVERSKNAEVLLVEMDALFNIY